MTSSRLRLFALLAGIALVVVVARSAEMARMLGGPGGTPWGQLLSTEAGIFAGWALWSAILVVPMERMVETKPRGAPLLLVLLAIAPVLLVPVVASPVHRWAFPGSDNYASAYVHMAAHNALTFLLLGIAQTGVAHSTLSLRRARELEVTAARLNAQLSDAQLATLRAQLDPHFLFNALNSVAVLARRGRGEDVEAMVTRLSALLRHSLDAYRAQEVTLGVELTALRHYLEIEQVRFGDRLRITIDVPEPLHARVVPSFLLQPLAENAIRHGFGDASRPLSIGVAASADGDQLRIVVEDDGTGLAGELREGTGLATTRARLAGLYGDRASFSIGAGAGGRGVRVEIGLP